MRGHSEFLTLTCTKCSNPVPNRVQRRPVIVCYTCQQKDRKERNRLRYTPKRARYKLKKT